MVKDPIIEEVRKIRLEIEEECGHDARAYYEHLKREQEKWPGRLTRRRPLPALEVKAAS
jgi:hypothetical protein